MTSAPPLDALARTAVLYGAGLTVWLVVGALRGAAVSAYQRGAALLFWVASAAVALAHVGGVLSDRAGHDLAVSAAYAAATVLVLPVLWRRDGGSVGDAVRDDASKPPVAHDATATRFAALGTGVTVVLLLRLGAVW